MRRLPVAVLATVVFSACGEATIGHPGSKSTIRNAGTDGWTERQVIEAADLTARDGGISYETPSGCTVAVILTSSNAVELYAGAGDAVATNPDGSAGVKFHNEGNCGEELAAGLATLK